MWPEMVSIPAGSFLMGADPADPFSNQLERPVQQVTFTHPFAIGRYPVTLAQWDVYVSSDPAAHRPRDHGWGRDRQPVIDVSWQDAEGYCRWLGAQTGRTYRLPSEAEWEYACRGGQQGIFNTGCNITVQQANFLYLDFGGRPGLGRPTPVGSYAPNAFGLYDCHGNVAEFTADDWTDSHHGAPSDGSIRQSASPLKVVRGAGWDAMPRMLRSAYRDWIFPTLRTDCIGFRVACSEPGVAQ